jgi:hypothetical protein
MNPNGMYFASCPRAATLIFLRSSISLSIWSKYALAMCEPK